MKSVQEFIKLRLTRLTFSYLAIIMSMSIVFSFFIYSIASSRISSSLIVETKNGLQTVILEDPFLTQILKQKASVAKIELINELVLLNLIVLILGALLSYYLAKKTLRPIEEALNAQSQFISDASHELKTPLTALLTMNEVALRKRTMGSKEVNNLIVQNIEEITKLRDLSVALLDLASQNKSRLELKKILLQDIVCEAVNQVIVLAQEKNIKLKDEVGNSKIYANYDATIRILIILLENAIKYSSSGKNVVIRSETKGSQVYLRVKDRGAGIDDIDKDKIFTRFYRADDSRSKIKADGYGLGLAIAKDLADRQGIQINVDSKKGEGSTFSIRFKQSK